MLNYNYDAETRHARLTDDEAGLDVSYEVTLETYNSLEDLFVILEKQSSNVICWIGLPDFEQDSYILDYLLTKRDFKLQAASLQSGYSKYLLIHADYAQ